MNTQANKTSLQVTSPSLSCFATSHNLIIPSRCDICSRIQTVVPSALMLVTANHELYLGLTTELNTPEWELCFCGTFGFKWFLQ